MCNSLIPERFDRVDSSGAQFHIEVTGADATKWAEEYAVELAQFGKSKSQIHAEYLAIESQMKSLAYLLMGN